MEKNLFLSVIIVTYNRKDTLEKALRSLFTQDYPKPDFEIIVVDDGSTDGTEELVQALNCEYAVKYLRQAHKSPAAARNLGIKNARGEIICFLDSDCIAPGHWLSAIAKQYQLHPEVISVGGSSEYVPAKYDLLIGAAKLFFYRIIPKEGGYIVSLPTRNQSYKKEIFAKEGYFDEFLGYPEDIDFNLRLTCKGYKIFISPELTIKHIHPFNLLDYYKREFNLGRAYYKLHLRFPKHYIPDFRIPDNFKSAFIFWLSPFLSPWLKLKNLGLLTFKNIFYIPFLILEQIVHRCGVYYELKNITEAEKTKWQNG